jgi:hypothetical protein
MQNTSSTNSSPSNQNVLPYWQLFKRGLLLFVISLGFIFAGYKWHPLIQVPGLILLLPALFFAGKGYLGILKHRLSASFSDFKK